jgi:hypothetical protein
MVPLAMLTSLSMPMAAGAQTPGEAFPKVGPSLVVTAAGTVRFNETARS